MNESENQDATFELAAEDPSVSDPERPRGSSFWLSLGLSIIALAVSVYVLIQQQLSPSGVDTSTVDETRVRYELQLSANKMRLDTIDVDNEAMRVQQQKLKFSLSSLESMVETNALTRETSQQASRADINRALGLSDLVKSSLAGTEQRLVAVESVLVSRDNRGSASFILDECEHLLILAQQSMLINKNPQIAINAIKLVDERLSGLNNPVFNSVRRALGSEIQSLGKLKIANIVEISAQIDRLQLAAIDWPLEESRTRIVDLPEDDSPLSSEKTLKDSALSLLSQFVEIRRETNTETRLLSPDQIRFLHLSIELHLESARIAALRFQQGLYEESLESVLQGITTYMDLEVASVETAIEKIVSLKAIQLSSDWVYQGEALQQLKNLRKTQQLSDNSPVLIP